jgi:hypothetical protein
VSLKFVKSKKKMSAEEKLTEMYDAPPVDGDGDMEMFRKLNEAFSKEREESIKDALTDRSWIIDLDNLTAGNRKNSPFVVRYVKDLDGSIQAHRNAILCQQALNPPIPAVPPCYLPNVSEEEKIIETSESGEESSMEV